MSVVVCQACGARNTQGGVCTLCGRPIGSLARAVVAAATASALLGAAWVGMATLTGLQVSWLAFLYGACVSGAVVHFSAGRGLLYQAIATSATLLGVFLADSLVVYEQWELLTARWGLEGLPRPPFWDLLPHQAQYDGVTLAFCVLGVMGGMWVWRQPDEP